MDVYRVAAFTYSGVGGNPAGVVICDQLPDAEFMQKMAKNIGYSETVFAAPVQSGYRVRYFAPETEVPFCGHATIALGAVFARTGIKGPVHLELKNGEALVEGSVRADGLSASLHSMPTSHGPVLPVLFEGSLDLFNMTPGDLDDSIPPAIIDAGARHLLLSLKQRERLSTMKYDQVAGLKLMREWDLATISLIFSENHTRYHARNPFAAGGVYEDPATGAAAAALVAYLTHLGIGTGKIEVIQGEDMGVPCLIYAEAPDKSGGCARVWGNARFIVD